MKSSLKLLIYIIVGFTFLSGGLETFRIFTMNIQIDDRIQVIARDVIELSMIDRYRREHISYMNTSVAKQLFYDLIREEFNLDSNLCPYNDSSIYGKFTLKVCDFYEGKYEREAGKMIQKENPTILIKGFTTIKPVVLGIKKRIPIYFNVLVKNRRVN